MPTAILAIDLAFTKTVQAFQPMWLTALMQVASDYLLPVIALIGMLLIVPRRHQLYQLIAVAIIASGYALIPALKVLIARPRPDASVVEVIAAATGYSFPSGHAMGAVLLGSILAMLLPRNDRPRAWRLVPIIGFAVLLVGYSRVYLGAHWLSDVLVGYCLGVVWVGVACMLARRYRLPQQHTT